MSRDTIAAGAIVLVIMLLIVGLVGFEKSRKTKQPTDAPPEPGLELRLGDKVLPWYSDARIIVLPTGERILVLAGGDGRGCCCYLPPLPPGMKSVGAIQAEKP